MNKTNIECLDYSWNPVAMRCTPVSEGCANCWHLVMANRIAGNPKITPELRAVYTGDLEPLLFAPRLEEPERLRKPSIIGVQFMGDLFHEAITFSTIQLIMKTVLNCSRHTFIFLTKRPQRMAEYFKWAAQNSNLVGFQPPSNAWIGVTVENQKAADERIPILLQIPAAVRFMSYEPALGRVDFSQYLKCQQYAVETTHKGHGVQVARLRSRLDWVIVGGETGPRARPPHPDWFRQVRDQCVEADVPFFFKQWGEYKPRCVHDDNGRRAAIGHSYKWLDENTIADKCGKKTAGYLLDGQEWREWPK